MQKLWYILIITGWGQLQTFIQRVALQCRISRGKYVVHFDAFCVPGIQNSRDHTFFSEAEHEMNAEGSRWRTQRKAQRTKKTHIRENRGRFFSLYTTPVSSAHRPCTGGRWRAHPPSTSPAPQWPLPLRPWGRKRRRTPGWARLPLSGGTPPFHSPTKNAPGKPAGLDWDLADFRQRRGSQHQCCDGLSGF